MFLQSHSAILEHGTGYVCTPVRKFAVAAALVITWTCSAADQPTEPWLQQRLEWFQDLKFGFMMHWAPYSQWGCIESWPLVEVDKWARPNDLPAWLECGQDMDAIYLTQKEGESLPERIRFSAIKPAPKAKIYLLGFRKALKWITEAGGVTAIEIPESLQKSPPCHHAFAFKMELAK